MVEPNAQPSTEQRPILLTQKQLCAAYPAIKLRTLRHWIAQARPREVSEGRVKRTIPGNGLEPALIRKGRSGQVSLIDERRFLEWLYSPAIQSAS